MTYFMEPYQPPSAEPESDDNSRRSTVHAVGAVGVIALPAILVLASLLTAFEKWGIQDRAARTEIDQRAFPLMIAAGVVMAASALVVIVVRTTSRGPFGGGTAWAVLAVLALPIAAGLVVTGAANLA